MNKQKFNSIVSDPTNVTVNDRNSLDDLAKEYPFSQIVRSLAAKAHSLEKSEAAQRAINIAAMYATDRNILKELVANTPVRKREESEKPSVESNKTSSPSIETTPKHSKVSFDISSFSADSEVLRNNLWEDLEKLKTSKANYLEFAEADEIKSSQKEAKKTSSKSTPKTSKSKTKASNKVSASTNKTTPKATKSTTKISSNKKTSIKTEEKVSKKATPAKKIVKKVTTSKVQPPVEKKAEAKKEDLKKKPLLKEKTSVKEQIDLIDEFIVKRPSISSKPVTSVDGDQKDLSEKSTSFGDDLISENLAQILVDQGKRQKAIDMYKKLIWKFPQKKGYFASQIEDLSK